MSRWLRRPLGLAFLMMLLGATTGHAQTAPNLGVAGGFAVLGGSTVTNTGATSVVGDLGVSPGSAVTGFPPGSVTGGTIHINDAVAAQAQADLTQAYNALAGQAFNTDLTGQDLGGMTLPPAVYRYSTSAQLTGTLTLDAQGNPNAVFIFQIGSTLTTASAASVIIINGGSNCNVYFQIGTSATLGTGTQFAGNILALSSITLNTGANVSGRLLARNGAVTLDTNQAALCAAVCLTVTLSPANLPAAPLGVAYNQIISASGGTSPYTFSVSAGSLPPGLSLNPGTADTAILSGTPTTAGSYTFSITAVDSAGCFGTRVYTIVVVAPACPTILLAPASLPQGILGTPYSENIQASGGVAPYVFSLSSGTLPPGLNLIPATADSATLSGTPTTVGSYTFTVTATDANGCLGSQVYTLVISNPACPTITLNPATLPAAISGIPYSQVISASGGTTPYTFAVTSGLLPPGLMLAPNGPSSALLSGTSTAPGNYTFTITATDANGCFTALVYNVVVGNPVCPTITLNPAILPAAISGVPYSQGITASGGTAPYTFAVTSGQLPPGLMLDPKNPTSALLWGTATVPGNYTFTITATDANGCFASLVYNMVVGNPVCPTITLNPATLPAAISGIPYSQVITASGGTAPYTFAVTSGLLPPGLMLAPNGPSSALLSGTSTVPGNYSFTITATDANGCFTLLAYNMVVGNPACPLIVIAPPNLPAAIIGVPYSQIISASGGTPPYAFTLISGQLPPGLSLVPNSASSVRLEGTPTTSGAFTFSLQVTDAAGCSSTISYRDLLVGIGTQVPIPTLGLGGLGLLLTLLTGIAISSLRGRSAPG